MSQQNLFQQSENKITNQDSRLLDNDELTIEKKIITNEFESRNKKESESGIHLQKKLFYENKMNLDSRKKIRYSTEYEIANQALMQKLEETLRTRKFLRDFLKNSY